MLLAKILHGRGHIYYSTLNCLPEKESGKRLLTFLEQRYLSAFSIRVQSVNLESKS
jgi:hypothetical protein